MTPRGLAPGLGSHAVLTSALAVIVATLGVGVAVWASGLAPLGGRLVAVLLLAMGSGLLVAAITNHLIGTRRARAWAARSVGRPEVEQGGAGECPERAQSARSAFVAGMSHDMRIPLNGVVGMIELVLEGPLSDEQREQLRMALQSSEALLTVVDDVIDFSRMELGRLELQAVELPLRETLGRALAPLALRAAEKGLELGYRVAPEVPERLVGDSGRLTQVIVNLVGNAVEFTDRGSVQVEAVLDPGTPRAGGEVGVVFSVRDTGIGIPEAATASVFEPFVQVRGTRPRRSAGTGLGLAISRRLVHLMGGEISVESVPGKGSVFHFGVRFLEGVVPVESRPLRGLRALVFEPEPLTRGAAADALERAGAEVTLAVDAGDAAERLRTGAFDLMVGDARLAALHSELGESCREALGEGARLIWLTSPARALRQRQELPGPSVIRPFPPSALIDAACLAVGREESDGGEARALLRPAGGFLNVLLAEDDRVGRLLAIRQLRQLGHSVTAVEDGLAASRLAERGDFDVILMDVEMPGTNGLEATALIRRYEAGSGRHAPIVAMTAHVLPGDRERFLAAGMDDYLAKPVRGDSLSAILDRARGGRPRQAAGAEPAADVEARLLSVLDGDRALLGEIASLFVADAPRRLDDLRDAIASGDEQRARRASHTLSGSAGNFSSPEVDDSLRRLRRLLRSDGLRDRPSRGRVERALVAAERHVDRLVGELARFSNANEPPGTGAAHG